jgi:hypothetical protein
MERQFLESLEADTGRDLKAWMEAIAAEDLTRRNDIIDWLRRQGFMFSKASWLERIYNNGGRPIYDGKSVKRPQRRPRGPREERGAATIIPFAPRLGPVGNPDPRAAEHQAPSSEARQDRPPPASATSPQADKAKLDELLARAKAYRPLASFLLAEISKAVPGAGFTAESQHVSISQGREFAVLAISAKELRLGLDLGDRPIAAPLTSAKFTNAGSRISPAITHMIILTDARQIDDALRSLFKEAAARAG